MKIVLMGYMGSGKSTVGKLLSELLNLPFKDLDYEIQKEEAMSIPEIFSKKGEIYFRKSESKVLKALLALDESFILATGGGTPCYANSLSEMLNDSETLTIYLKVPLQVLCERLMAQRESRPILSHLNTKEELLEFVGIHLFERSYFYNQAEIIIDAKEDLPATVAKKIAENLF